MANHSRRKGFGFEREVVQQATAMGLSAYRCWGSDGRSRGLAKDVDLVLEGDGNKANGGDDSSIHFPIHLQTKRRSKLPGWLGLSDGVDGVVLRCDHGESVVVIRLADYLGMLSDLTGRRDDVVSGIRDHG